VFSAGGHREKGPSRAARRTCARACALARSAHPTDARRGAAAAVAPYKRGALACTGAHGVRTRRVTMTHRTAIDTVAVASATRKMADMPTLLRTSVSLLASTQRDGHEASPRGSTKHKRRTQGIPLRARSGLCFGRVRRLHRPVHGRTVHFSRDEEPWCGSWVSYKHDAAQARPSGEEGGESGE
jgi:hypothetical protein